MAVNALPALQRLMTGAPSERQSFFEGFDTDYLQDATYLVAEPALPESVDQGGRG